MSNKKCRGISKELVVQFIQFCSLLFIIWCAVCSSKLAMRIVQSVNCRDVGRDPPCGGLNCPTTTITDIAHCLSIILNHPPLLTLAAFNIFNCCKIMTLFSAGFASSTQVMCKHL